jgi:hypothetical protein
MSRKQETRCYGPDDPSLEAAGIRAALRYFTFSRFSKKTKNVKKKNSDFCFCDTQKQKNGPDLVASWSSFGGSANALGRAGGA